MNTDLEQSPSTTPDFSGKQSYKKKGVSCVGYDLPLGKQEASSKRGLWLMLLFIGIPFGIHLFFTIRMMLQSGFQWSTLLQFYPYLCMLAILLYFFLWDKHLGTLLVNGKTHIWPKEGVYSFYKGNRIQTILILVILGMFFVIAPWFFAIIFIINGILSLVFKISWKRPTPMEIQLSQSYYLLGDTLHFTIKTKTAPQVRTIEFYNLETIKVRTRNHDGDSWDRHSKVLYFATQTLAAGEIEARFPIPVHQVTGTDFSKEESIGWIIKISNGQENIHNQPFLLPIFEA